MSLLGMVSSTFFDHGPFERLSRVYRLLRLCGAARFMAAHDMKPWFDRGLHLGSLSGPLHRARLKSFRMPENTLFRNWIAHQVSNADDSPYSMVTCSREPQ